MRITEKQLEAIVERINEVTGSPLSAYTEKKGKYKSNLGNYHLSYAYGGVSLHRVCNENGGIEDVFSCGHTTKRDLANRMWAFLKAKES